MYLVILFLVNLSISQSGFNNISIISYKNVSYVTHDNSYFRTDDMFNGIIVEKGSKDKVIAEVAYQIYILSCVQNFTITDHEYTIKNHYLYMLFKYLYELYNELEKRLP
jgi:hypothetical protein